MQQHAARDTTTARGCSKADATCKNFAIADSQQHATGMQQGMQQHATEGCSINRCTQQPGDAI
jgi:hypothetical protein